MSLPRMLLGACALIVALAVAAPAQAAEINGQITLTQDNANPCTGEAFEYTQTWHINAHTDIDPFGEEYVVSQHLNSTQTDGIGLVSGDKYEVNQIGNQFDHPFSNGAHPSTGVVSFHVIDTGKGDDFFIDEVLHETINANGEITIFHEAGNVRCGNDNTHVGVKL